MPVFLAQTSRGLIEVLEQELKALGFDKTRREVGGVQFETNWEGCYKANLHLRTATRVIMPVLDFYAYNGDDLYHNLLKHDFTKYIEPHQTIAIDAKVRDCGQLKDQRFVAMKMKDAIVDQFREKFGERPDVDSKSADLKLIVRAVNHFISVSVDTSGEPLYKRGYRLEQVEAPMKEHLAAGLLLLAGYNGDQSVVDPMCGSGTLLIEAALMALNIAPGTLRSGFGFQKLKNYNEEAFDKVVSEALEQEKDTLDFKFFGYDKNRDAIHAAKQNVKAAGLTEHIEILRENVDLIEPLVEKGFFITNPPYGERLDENVADSYRDLSFALKNKFKGWTAWILSGNPELTSEMRLKTTQKIPVWNGPIECRLLKYDMF